jgi:Flp pilus assembly protein TadG
VTGKDDIKRIGGDCMSELQAALSRRGFWRPSLTGRAAAHSRLGVLGEEGATLVEMALCSSTLLCILFGIMGLSAALYVYSFVSDASRDATRWAMVRGSQSCNNTPNLNDCSATSAEIQAYVQSMGYPGLVASNLQVSTNWLSASATQPTTWSSCTAGTCNRPGNEVQVQVTYTVNIPLVGVPAFNLTSASAMVIAQ